MHTLRKEDQVLRQYANAEEGALSKRFAKQGVEWIFYIASRELFIAPVGLTDYAREYE